MNEAPVGFAVLYRFRVRPEDHRTFEEAWAVLTELIRHYSGGRGSRLHRSDDGLLYAYAQWDDRASWEAAGSLPTEAGAVLSTMAATAEQLEPVPLEVLCDRFDAPPV